ncbi:MAG: hypothetical protein ACLTGR_05055 [Eubacterium sp.]
MGNYREFIKDKKRIVIKIGSSSLMHEQTGRLDLLKIEKLVRILIDIKNSGKDVVLVSSGAIAVGRAVIGLNDRPTGYVKRLALIDRLVNGLPEDIWNWCFHPGSSY